MSSGRRTATPSSPGLPPEARSSPFPANAASSAVQARRSRWRIASALAVRLPGPDVRPTRSAARAVRVARALASSRRPRALSTRCSRRPAPAVRLRSRTSPSTPCRSAPTGAAPPGRSRSTPASARRRPSARRAAPGSPRRATAGSRSSTSPTARRRRMRSCEMYTSSTSSVASTVSPSVPRVASRTTAPSPRSTSMAAIRGSAPSSRRT